MMVNSPAQRSLPLFAVFEETAVKNDGMAETNLLSLSYGRIVPKSIDTVGGLLPASFETYQIVNPGQIVLRLTDMQNDQKSLRSGLVQERGIITSAYCALQSRGWGEGWNRYFDYFFHALDVSKQLYSLGGGVRQSLKYADIKHVRVLIPSESARDQIVRYLDVETAKIDHLIAKQRKLESLLDERELPMREALFGCYVGTGERLKWHLSETTTRLGSVDLGEHPLLSVSIHWGVRPRAETIGEASTADRFDHYKTVDVGDIIVNRMRAFQGALGSSTFTGFTSPDYAVFKPDGEIDPSWLMQVMKTQSFVGEMTNRLTGIGGTEGGKVRTPRINSDDLLNIRIDIPSQSRQRANVSEFQTQIQEITKLKESTERMITLLQERRSALITAAVTGQIEV